MVRLYTNSVVNEVRSARSNGAWFTSREYIKIAGNDGLRATFSNLSLSSKDRNYIEGEVQSIGIDAIDIKEKQEVLQQKLQAVKENFANTRNKVQEMYLLSIENSKDDTLCRYKDNILAGILDEMEA